MMTRRAFAAAAIAAAAVSVQAAETPRTFTLTTKSEAARAKLREVQERVESFQGGQQSAPLIKEILELDPDFAMGVYYLSATTPPPDNQKHLDRAVALAKNASEGERRFIDAMVLARGKTPADAVEPLRKLAADYPGERVLYMLLGQNLAGLGRHDEARTAFEQAIKISDKTPRAYSLLGNYHLMKGDYARAREQYQVARTRIPKGVPPGGPTYGIAFTHLYEGDVDQALKVLTAYVDDYRNAPIRGDLPEVFIWNSIARINLENGRLDEAMKAYEKAYESIPGSKLADQEKTIWLGRLHHGRGRTLARMGKHAEAWKEAQTIRTMIDEGGERGKQFEPSYHYIAGYLKLEAGETAAAIEHLKQAEIEDDPFHKLLLARAYDKAGNTAEAKKLYGEIVDFPNSNLERALAYREAKKRLSAL